MPISARECCPRSIETSHCLPTLARSARSVWVQSRVVRASRISSPRSRTVRSRTDRGFVAIRRQYRKSPNRDNAVCRRTATFAENASSAARARRAGDVHDVVAVAGLGQLESEREALVGVDVAHPQRDLLQARYADAGAMLQHLHELPGFEQ